MKPITLIGKAATDSGILTPVDILKLVLSDIEASECKANKLLVVYQEPNETKNGFNQYKYCANINEIDLIVMTELCKQSCLDSIKRNKERE